MDTPKPPALDDTFVAAVALVRAGLHSDEAGMHAIIDTTDPTRLLLATAALAALLGGAGTDTARLDAILAGWLTPGAVGGHA